MADKKKPSGAFYRKRKKEQVIENKKRTVLLKKFFFVNKPSSSFTSTTNVIDCASASTSSVVVDNSDKKLQEVDMNIANSLALISSTKQFFQETRSDAGFNRILVDCREVAEMIEVDPAFPKESELRPRKKKKMFSYESSDETVLDPEIVFKTKFFYAVLDQCISSLGDRFEQLQNYHQLFGFLHSKTTSDDKTLLKCCKDLHIALTDGQHSDIDSLQLYSELKLVNSMIQNVEKEDKGKIKGPVDMLSYLADNGFVENFPNLCVALRILLTLPVSVASGEIRSFSKLKIVKNYLRSSMSQDRLV